MEGKADFSKSKMYFLIKASVDIGHAALSVGHGALGGYLDFIEAERKKDFQPEELCPECGEPLGDDEPTQTERWVKESFRKCLCAVTDEEFEKAKAYGVAGQDYRVMTESGLGGMEVAIVFRPRDEWEPFFKSLPLWGKRKTSKDGLFSCPFCGEFPPIMGNSPSGNVKLEDVVPWWRASWSVKCCIADTGKCGSKEEAIAKWNKRA